VQCQAGSPLQWKLSASVAAPSLKGEALEKSTPSGTYFRVERGVDFRNFQPLQRSRRLNRTFRWHASRHFASFAAIKTIATTILANEKLATGLRSRWEFFDRMAGFLGSTGWESELAAISFHQKAYLPSILLIRAILLSCQKKPID